MSSIHAWVISKTADAVNGEITTRVSRRGALNVIWTRWRPRLPVLHRAMKARRAHRRARSPEEVLRVRHDVLSLDSSSLTIISWTDLSQEREPTPPVDSDQLASSKTEQGSYLAWLQKVLSGRREAGARPQSVLKRAFPDQHVPLVCALVFSVQQGSVIHPWTNPLNGPLSEWSAGSSPCLSRDNVPAHGKLYPQRYYVQS